MRGHVYISVYISFCGCRHGDLQVSERAITVGELLAAHKAGRLLEVFGCGTACVVQPVSCVVTSEGQEMQLPAAGAAADTASGAGESIGEWARRQLLDIQYGRVPHPWSVPFE